MSEHYSFQSSTQRASGHPRTRRGHPSADNQPVATDSPYSRFPMPVHMSSSTSSPTEEDSTTPEGSPSRVAKVQTPDDQFPLPSLVPRSDSGIFVNNSHVPSRLHAGVTMGRISSTEDTSSSEDDFHDALQSMLPLTSFVSPTTQPHDQASDENSTPTSVLRSALATGETRRKSPMCRRCCLLAHGFRH